jgi:hypothetical protein
LTAFARLLPLLLTLSLVFASAGPPIAASALESEPGRAGVNFGTGESPFYLYVEKGSFSITVFYKDADGNYTIPLRTFPTAIGRSARMTPTGVFHKGRTELWHSWGSTWSPYASAYSPGLYVHGPIYLRKEFGGLWQESARQIGTPASSGCLRTSAEAAYFVSALCPEGTTIHIVDGSPLGFYAPAISVSEQYSNPAGRTLDEIFPELARVLQEIEAAQTPVSPGMPGDGLAHLAWEKAEQNPELRITLRQRELAFELGAGGRGGNGGGAGGTGGVPSKRLTARLSFGAGSGESEDGAGEGGSAPDQAVLWLSSDPRVAAVSSDGTVYAVGAGEANVIALTADGIHTAACAVTVSYAKEADGGDSGGGAGENSGGDTGNVPGAKYARRAAARAFPDMDAWHWAAEAVGRLKLLKILSGNGVAFAPDDDITRAEFIKILVLARNSQETYAIVGPAAAAANAAAEADAIATAGAAAATAPEADADVGMYAAAETGADDAETNSGAGADADAAADTNVDAAADATAPADAAADTETGAIADADSNAAADWHRPYYEAAAAYGILTPDESAASPDAFLTREEFRLWADRAFASGGQPLNAFSDGSFRPDGFVTRALAAQIVNNYIVDRAS